MDVALDNNFETYWSENGDIGVVDGEDRIVQGIALRLKEFADLSTPSPTPSAIESQRSDIETVVRNTDVTQPPIDVYVVSSVLDEDTNSMKYAVQTSRIVTVVSTEE